MTDRVPPHSPDAERAVLGAMIMSREAIEAVTEVLTDPICFYEPSHQKIFEAIVSLHDATKPVDLTTIADEMERQDTLGQSGGRTYLSELAGDVGSGANAKFHAETIMAKYRLRQMIKAASEISAECYGERSEVDDILDAAEQRIFAIADRQDESQFALIGQTIPDVFDRISDLHEAGGGLVGLPTGFKDADDVLGGMKNGELIIVAGRPSMGKTALAINIAENVCRMANTGVAVFSVEMSREGLAQRLICSDARLNFSDIQHGRVTDVDWKRLAQAATRMARLSLFVDSVSTITPMGMRSKLRRLMARQKIGLVIIDYLQLMDSERRSENRQQEITQITRRLKAMAIEFNVPVMALSQLSRAVEIRGGTKRPQLSDLRESGAIEQDADVVMFVYRPEYYMGDLPFDNVERIAAKGIAEIIIAKQRNGPTGSARLYFSKDFVRFENLSNQTVIPASPAGEGQPF